MAEEMRMNRPSVSGPRFDTDPHGHGSHSSSKTPWIVLVIAIIIIAVVGVLFRDKLFGSSTKVDTSKSSGYQAIFLTNGQVYFGKLSHVRGDYATLRDIYYLQVTQDVQGPQDQGQAQQQQQQKLTLVKLGSELHGPVDEMKINRNQILFFEDMKTDGKVYEAIKSDKDGTNKSSGQATPPAVQKTTPNAAPVQTVTPPPAAVTPPKVTPPPVGQ